MKKFFACLLAALLIVSVSACAKPQDDPILDRPSVPSEPENPNEPDEPSEPSEPEQPSEPDKPSEPEQGKITYKSISKKFTSASGVRFLLKGQPNAKVKLTVHYFDSDRGLWLLSEFEDAFDATGALTLEMPLSSGVTEIEAQIAISKVFDEALQQEVKVEAEIVEIELLDPPAPPPLIAPPVKEIHATMPSVGTVRSLTVFVEFPNRTFENACSKEVLQEEIYGEGKNGLSPFPYESLSAWYARASYGNLTIEGDVYFYTCKEPIENYLGENHEKILMEALQGLDGEIDYAPYDSDGNGTLDQLTFAIPVLGDPALSAFWYSATFSWYEHAAFRVDGVGIDQYVGLDIPPTQNDLSYFKSSLAHEIGHCMGLPDFYKYESEDWEGFHGDAGYACLDDAIGDFCGFSKLLFGWFREGEAQIYEGEGEQQFTLYSLSERASCVILPIESNFGYFSEYFLAEFITPTQNNSILNGFAVKPQGVRIFHIQAETATMAWGTKELKYNNYSRFYEGDDKIRVIRLVNDGNGFYQEGDVCTFGAENFAAYDLHGDQTIDTGYTVKIGKTSGKSQQITVTREF